MSELQEADASSAGAGPSWSDRMHLTRIMTSVGHMVDCVGMMQTRVRALERMVSLLVFLLLLMSVVNGMVVARLLALGG